jgi:hypothetical protein
MKTPREILLGRHQAAGPKLDAIRKQALSKLSHQNTQTERQAASWVSLIFHLAGAPWRELILPSRRIWMGLGAVWAVLILINVLQGDHTGRAAGSRAVSPSVMASWQVQQRWMNELLADRAIPPDTDRPRNPAPRPRSEETRWAMA